MNIQHALALKKAFEHLQAHRPIKTIAIASRVLEQDPTNADAWFLSGIAYHDTGQYLQALDRLNRACQLVPDAWDYLNHRATVLYHLGRIDESRTDYEHSLRLHNEQPETLANLARLFIQIKQPHLAHPLFQKALALDPNNASLHGDMGVCLVALKSPMAGIARYRAGLALAPEDADIHYNLSRALLMVGDYRQGWIENEWRWRAQHYRNVDQSFPFPLWQGEPLHGKKILLIQEQGFGDTIQMIRYAPLLAQRGGKVLVSCDPLLQRLFATMPSVEHAATLESPFPKADYCCPMLSLPQRFATCVETIPRKVPYLFPPQTPPFFPGEKDPFHPRVGLIWRGKSRGQLTASAFAPLLDIPGIQFISLQKDLLPNELDHLPITDAQTHLTDFAATSTIMAPLDLIISMETAAAHLAGAMGKPVWILIPYASEWRWLSEGTEAPWYPTATLYRQTKPDSWTDTIAQMAHDLTSWILRFSLSSR
ncbi:MAG: glycosyltransferase family protein [Nitrospirae bacterium]|nr:glycosyltransferase family protein [Magnetococcales bacterium]HAT50623.1 hypothetical protein [Alphaproteobacteria bacterium]